MSLRLITRFLPCPPILVLAAALALACARPAAAAEEFPDKKNFPNVHLNETGITSSAECAKCHKDIHSTWKNSLHAQSAVNPVFQTAYIQAYFERGEDTRKTCLLCHAPVAALNDDYKLTRELTREGINCDYCHSISEVMPSTSGPRNRFEFGLLKQGPLDKVRSPVHKTQANELYKHSEFCGGCHEYASPNGVKLIETFSEWKQGPYPAKNTQCQNCHMRKVVGKIVAEDVKQTAEKEISSHDIAGGHSLSMQEKSVEVKIAGIERNKQKVTVTVEVTNRGAGHKLPTGLPSKKVILLVAVASRTGEAFQTQQKIFQKMLVDEHGEPVTRDADLLLGKGVKVTSDNRIAPMETRRESFTFFIPDENKDNKIIATVYYDHQPQIIQPAGIHTKLTETQELLK